MSALAKFSERLYEEWLPAFCNATHRQLDVSGFRKSTISKLDEFDAKWFLRAIHDDLVSESDGFFVAPQSKAKEQLFWTGRKNINPRPITLWIEPIITIGALARLTRQFGWPANRLGMQSKTWAFDLVCYRQDLADAQIACEVKKSELETKRLIEFIQRFLPRCLNQDEPVHSARKNAFRKSKAIIQEKPDIFWALGPGNTGAVFEVLWQNRNGQIQLRECGADGLAYGGA